MFSDIHCHLDEIKDIEKLVSEAKQKNVHALFSNSVDLKSMQANLELAKRFPEIKPLLGLHPKDILEMSTEQIRTGIEFLQKQLKQAVGIGEIGLDYKYAETSAQKQRQQEVFGEQIGIAIENNLAVEIHSRRSRTECLETLERLNAEKVLFHWFNGNRKQIQQIVDCGWFASLGPSILFQDYNLEMVQALPLENLLLETDCPVPFNGKDSRPSWIPEIAKKVAEVKECSLSEVEHIAERNLEKLF